MSADDAATIKELRFELRKVGVNLNQTTRQINAARLGAGSAPDPNAVETLIETIQKLIARITKTI